jgi:hypothetical protein
MRRQTAAGDFEVGVKDLLAQGFEKHGIVLCVGKAFTKSLYQAPHATVPSEFTDY